MFKILFKLSRLKTKPVPKEKTEADKAAVFAKLGLAEHKTEKNSENFGKFIINSDEPQKVYPRKVPLIRRLAAPAAAAVLIAAAIPVGTITAKKISGSLSANSAGAGSSPDVQKAEPVEALKLYYEKQLSDFERDHPDEKRAESIDEAELSSFYRSLELSGTVGDLTVKLRGVLDTGFGSAFVVYEFDAGERAIENMKIYALTYPSDGTDAPFLSGDIVDTIYGNGSGTNSLGGLRVAHIKPMNGGDAQLDNYEKLDRITLAFSPRYSDEENMSFNDRVKRSVKLEIPFNYNSMSLNARTKNGSTYIGGGNYEYSFNSFACYIRSMPSRGNRQEAFRAVMKDGTIIRNIERKQAVKDNYTVSLFSLFTVPIDVNDVARIDVFTGDGTTWNVIYDADNDTGIGYPAPSI